MHEESKFKAAVFATPAADADTAALRAYATCIFRAIFADDIAFKLSVGDKYKGSEHQPAPLNFDALMGESAGESLPDAVAEQLAHREQAVFVEVAGGPHLHEEGGRRRVLDQRRQNLDLAVRALDGGHWLASA